MNRHKNLLIVLGEWWGERQRCSRSNDTIVNGTASRRFLRWLVPNGGTILLILVLILTQQVWARPGPNAINAPGPSANTVNYQGRLADPAGDPVPDGNYAMTFTLWDAPSDGTLVWGPEDHTVPVSDGLFSVGLGSKTAIPTTTWDGDRYLEIAVDGETLSPRELIRSVPIAGMALTAWTVPDGSITTEKIAEGAITSEKQAIATFRTNDSNYVVHQGTEETVVSEFSFENVPAGDVIVIVSLFAKRPEGATQEGYISLCCTSTDTELDRVPTHHILTEIYGSQVMLHGHLEDFSGGTLTLQISAYGENDNVEIRFGWGNGDPRFGRDITIVTGL